jgi:hypothetical protein
MVRGVRDVLDLVRVGKESPEECFEWLDRLNVVDTEQIACGGVRVAIGDEQTFDEWGGRSAKDCVEQPGISRTESVEATEVALNGGGAERVGRRSHLDIRARRLDRNWEVGAGIGRRIGVGHGAIGLIG